MNIKSIIDRALRRSRGLGAREGGSCATSSLPSFEIADLLLPVLRRIADETLERACDNGGDWDDEISARVRGAARMADAFDLAALSPRQIADLADNALRWAEPSQEMPATMDDIGEGFLRLATARELIKLRDRARRAAAGSDGC
jgi:hypothetical protein